MSTDHRGADSGLNIAGGTPGRYIHNSPAEWAYTVFPFDEFTGDKNIQKSFSVSPNTLINARSLVDPAHDIVLTVYSNASIRAYKLSDASLLWTLTHNWYSGTYDNWYHSIHWVRDGEAVLISSSSGKVTFFNYLSQDIILKTMIDGSNWAQATAYDSVNHVIVAIGTDLKTRVFVPVAVPHHFDGPTLNPSSPEQYGHANVTAQLLGDQNEPCADWWVHWRLLNGKGWLRDYVGQTDKNGYVYNYYYSPTLESQLGSERIYVEVIV
jgi:hypothetical protein